VDEFALEDFMKPLRRGNGEEVLQRCGLVNGGSGREGHGESLAQRGRIAKLSYDDPHAAP
jgi:hypothetical protein